MPEWFINSAMEEIRFACISAFQLTKPNQESTLPFTHFLFLRAEYNPNATRKRDQMRLMNAVLLHQQDSAEDPLFYPANDVQLARDGIRDDYNSKQVRDDEIRSRNRDDPRSKVHCLISFTGHDSHSSSGKTIRMNLCHPAPFVLPMGSGQYESGDGEFWAKGLFQNLKQDASPSNFRWRARMRFELMRLNAGEPIDPSAGDKPTDQFPNPIHSKINFNRSTPDVILSLSTPLLTCPSECCITPELPIVHNPITRMELDLVFHKFLWQNFEDHLRHWAEMTMEQLMFVSSYSENRISSLLLAGATLEQLTLPLFASSNADILVKMMFSQASVIKASTGMICFMALQSCGLKRHCAHSHFDIDALRNLVNEPFKTPRLRVPLFDKRMYVLVLEKIELYIKQGDLTGADWKDSNKWKQSILSALELFDTSFKLATRKFFSTTPKFAAPYHHFIRNFTHIINWTLLEPTDEEVKEIEEWLDAGGMMQPDDPLLARTDGTKKSCTKAGKNARKKAKKLAKTVNEVNVDAEELKQMRELGLD